MQMILEKENNPLVGGGFVRNTNTVTADGLKAVFGIGTQAVAKENSASSRRQSFKRDYGSSQEEQTLTPRKKALVDKAEALKESWAREKETLEKEKGILEKEKQSLLNELNENKRLLKNTQILREANEKEVERLEEELRKADRLKEDEITRLQEQHNRKEAELVQKLQTELMAGQQLFIREKEEMSQGFVATLNETEAKHAREIQALQQQYEDSQRRFKELEQRYTEATAETEDQYKNILAREEMAQEARRKIDCLLKTNEDLVKTHKKLEDQMSQQTEEREKLEIELFYYLAIASKLDISQRGLVCTDQIQRLYEVALFVIQIQKQNKQTKQTREANLSFNKIQ